MTTLVVLAHPDLGASRANAALAEAARTTPDVHVHDLYAAYPDRRISVAREQQLLLAHDRVVLQFPFYWYSVPPLLKSWLDGVLEYGFAYGSQGTSLHGKVLQIATTTGGPADAYHPDGYNRFPIRDLLLPFDATAHLTGMRYADPFVVHGTRVLTDEQLADETDRYRRLLREETGRPSGDGAPEETEAVPAG
ncbi:NAD(P)H-dependent oxidoreductase [Streptomyces sp. CT34]|uniref:NAD(P)H-dependent oxidoreductase n=1 Tax=Streptomyces sp. CT34 TaxID=1553907 RepID=UPI0007C73EEC|nr:NAD(P)H-dependent oxidoreductase [Streptomyces sp. CT34]